MSRQRETATVLPSFEELASGADPKACCAAVYQHPGVHWLLGGELHPGGEATTRRSLELLGVGPGDRLLDVASGAGDSALLAAAELGCAVAGLEYGPVAVATANAAAEAAGLGATARFHRGDAEALPFADGEFDALLCECALCTFPDKPRAVNEMRRVLRPGGRLVISDVVVDRSRLPAELDGALATIACVGAALSRRGYEDLLAGARLHVIASESRDEDAAALAERVHDRLRGMRVMGVDAWSGSPLELDRAIELAETARAAIRDGALGYAIVAAIG
jgi:SAM-dependent methyltransferase